MFLPDNYICIHFHNFVKENLESDGQQYHKYQQNEQPPLTSHHVTQCRPQHVALEIQGGAWDSDMHLAGLNRII